MINLLDAMAPAIWRASWQAGLLAVFVTLALKLLGERVAPRWRYWLWSVVVLRFLFVVTPAAPWSVFNVARFGGDLDRETVVNEELSRQPSAISFQQERLGGQLLVASNAEFVEHSPVTPAASPVAALPAQSDVSAAPVLAASDPAVPLPNRRDSMWDSLSIPRLFALCWFLGCLACVAQLIVAAVRLRRRLRVCRAVVDERVLALLRAASAEAGLRQSPTLLVTPEPVSPCLIGTWLPRIVVPESLMAGGAVLPLRQVLAHEVAHVARNDQWTNWPLLASGVVHWFNPLAWWTLREMRAEREAACDDSALGGSPDCDRSTYAETILSFATGRSPSPIAPGMIGLFSSKQSVARRMKRVLAGPVAAPFSSLAVIGLALVLALVGLTDAMPPTTAVPTAAPVPAEEPRKPAVSTNAETELDAVAPEAGDYEIPGYCTDTDQNRLAGVRVKLFAVHGFIGAPIEIMDTVSDADGKFRFTGLAPPRDEDGLKRLSYGVVAFAEGHPPAAALEMFRRSHPRREVWLRMESGEPAALTGKVVNQRGEPVAGAIVTRSEIAGQPFPGVHMAVTDEDGQFAITDLPVVEADPDRPYGVRFLIIHPDYPPTRASAPMVPADVTAVIPDGCTITGRVVSDVTVEPVQGVIVVAENNSAPDQDRAAVTDAEGRFKIVVTEGVYNVVVKSADGVAVAVTDQDCQAGKTIDVLPLKLGAGGVISGRVVNAVTGKPVVMSESGGRVAIGLYGPAHPPREKIISPTRLATVDDEGRFTIWAAAGENFPYLVNIRGERMAWDTRDQKPVIVKAGEMVATEIRIVPEKTAGEKMAAARQVLASLPKERVERVAQILEEWTTLSPNVSETELWCLLVKELVTIGPDAVPQLCAALDQTTEGHMLRRLGFTLRAIGDPRAVPALIRAIPKVLDVSGGDYGLRVDDPELMAFMQQHDWSGGRRNQYFDFERPFREIVGALQKITGQNFEDATMENISQSDDPRRRILQRRLFQQYTSRWAQWWEEHWQEFTNDESYAKVNLAVVDESLPAATTELGPDAKKVSRVIGKTLSPATEKGRFIDHFLDLDTGYQPNWPAGISRDEASLDWDKLSAWAAENGVDVMCVTYEAPDGSQAYVLRGFDLKVTEISASDAQRLDRIIGAGSLPEGREVDDLLLHHDGAKLSAENGAFLYVTREGCMGLIEVTDRITRVADLTGLTGSAPPGTGFQKGVKFNLTTIVP